MSRASIGERSQSSQADAFAWVYYKKTLRFHHVILVTLRMIKRGIHQLVCRGSWSPGFSCFQIGLARFVGISCSQGFCGVARLSMLPGEFSLTHP